MIATNQQTESQIQGQNMENFKSEKYYDGEEAHVTKVYIDAQLFLENRHVVAYPNGRGGVETSICKKHAQYGLKLMDENQLLHHIFFEGHWSAMRKQEGIN